MTSEESVIEAYSKAIAAWTDNLLRPYLAILTEDDRPARQKEFNDPLWGTLVLLPHEVVLLDSPLLQRLRRIRQLGVAHLVYPAAQHTRTEHSLGATHQMQQLIESLNTHPIGETEKGVIDDEMRCLLRLGALCHDVGHGLMSHVVENALSTNVDVIRLLTAFKRDNDLDQQPQLGEVAAFHILGTAAFGELLKHAFRLGERHCPADTQQQLQHLIIQKKINDRFPTVHELLSGPFDADKLAYLPRDARMCGVPVVTDVIRLVQKVRAVRKPALALPPEIARVVEDVDTCIVTGIARSGASTLDELALGRSLMFDKIYRHQKVRAAEAMVATALEQVGSLIELNPALLPLAIDDDQLLRLTAAWLTDRLGVASLSVV